MDAGAALAGAAAFSATNLDAVQPGFTVWLDDILVEASESKKQRAAEAQAIKVAEAAPRTELAIGLRALARQVRASSDDITYGDLS